MKQKILYLIISLIFNLSSFASCFSGDCFPDSINDGPYIFYANNKFAVEWIENDLFRTDNISQKNFSYTKNKFNLSFDYKDLRNAFLLEPRNYQIFNRVDSIAAVSDIHGEYESYIKLMRSQGIIDDKLNWKFGKGHLVVLGDIFDRGNMVTEVLWHLFGLEIQAAKAGGMVHLVLGNHEMLLFGNNLRYTNEKYIKVGAILGNEYSQLYSIKSVLGQWLRNQPVMLSINDIIFVHGGVSIEMVRHKLKIEQINQLFSDMLLGEDVLPENKLEDLRFLINRDGPIWYRGFFTDNSFCESKLDSILNFYNKKHIVAGHTTIDEISSYFDNKIFGIDTGLGINQPGGMLIYKNGNFYQGLITGDRIELH